jgi:chorismate synthase
MAGSNFGNLLTLTTFGESHGAAIGGILDGFPAGIQLDLKQVAHQMARRKPGQSAISTQRKEEDEVQLLSGVFEGISTGTPIGFLIANEDAKSKDYSHLEHNFRPSHADRVYQEKYGHRDYRGGGRSSARETATRVAAGALVRQITPHITITAYVSSVGLLDLEDSSALDYSLIDSNIARCPHPATAEKFIAAIKDARKEGDSLGGIITCRITGVDAGLGEPVFNKLQAELGKAMLSINAVKGFEIGSGFSGARMKGSEHNDSYTKEGRRISNNGGGVEGGISNGEEIIFRVAFKPVATIMQDQQGINDAGEVTTIKGKGRHDPCVVPRAVPIVEAMAALVLADYYLIAKTNKI